METVWAMSAGTSGGLGLVVWVIDAGTPLAMPRMDGYSSGIAPNVCRWILFCPAM